MQISTTDHLEYCKQLIKKHNYARYLQLAFAPERVKGSVIGYYALDAELKHIHHHVSEEMIGLLETTSSDLGFKRIQGLIRLYIRQGLDRDHQDYTLAHDEVFIETLRKRGVSQHIIDEAIVVTHNNNITHPLSELQDND